MSNSLAKKINQLPGKNVLNKVESLQKSLQALPEEEQVKLIPNHYFAPGMYCRELFIPEGVVCTGKVHKHAHITILAEGTSAMVSQDGQEVFTAPHIFTSTVGAKRAVLAVTDCTWITVHLNPEDKTEIEELENDNVVDTVQQLLESKE